MLSSTETQPHRLCRTWLNVLAALLCLVAAPAIASVSIEGVTEGQVVTGDLDVSAVSTHHRLTDLMIVLTGPGGTEQVNRSGASRVSLMGDPADVWDSTQALAGSYSVAAYATSRGRTGRVVNTAVVNFVVENDNRPEAPDAFVAPAPTGDAPAPAADADEAVEEPRTTTPNETPVADDKVALEAGPPVIAPPIVVSPSIGFAAGTPGQRIIGDSASIRVELENADRGADVLILVWNLDRRAVVEGVSAILTPGNLVVPAGLLDRLPAGNMEIQAHYRVNGKIEQTVRHIIANAEPTPVVEPTGPESLPAVSFSAGTPQTFTIGSTQSLSFDVDGDMPSNGDLLVIAWSLDESRLVPGFAQVFTEAPWTISAQTLNLLPPGQVELQLRPRYNGQISGKVAHTMTVAPQVVAELPQPVAPADPVDPADPADDGDTQAGGDASSNDDAVADADTDTNDGASAAPDDTADQTAGESADADNNNAPVDINVAFADGTPSQYVPGSGDPITLDLDAPLPTGGDVLMLMWHKDRNEMVGDFAHELSGSSLQVSNAKLDAAPVGNVELQALLRVPGQAIKVRKMSLYLVDPDAPEEDQTADHSDTDTNYDDLDLTSDGFTKFTKSSDTRVIYVAANGNDSNDGLSTARPMRTASAAYKKLRDGKPDWLLFKAGDTFRGNLGTINKSGRSSSERMLIGTYGNGPRPIMLTTGGHWAIKYFQTKGDHVAIVGLHIIAEKRDPNRAGFNSSRLTQNEWDASAVTFLGDAQDVLVEDCVMEYFKFAMVMQSSPNDGYIRDVKLRRNAILYSYGHWDKSIAGHSSGLYAAYTDGLLIEENVWHHNGWNDRVSGAKKTKFNHNMYVQDNCTGNSVVRGNIITNGSAHGLQLRSGGDVIDNLFVGNPLAFFVGRYESDVLRNVVLKSQDMGSGGDEVRGHGIEILPCLYARVENNIVSQKQGSADFAYAIGFNHESSYSKFLGNRPFKASLKDNKIYRWPRDNGNSSAIKFGTKPQLTANTRNDLDKASGGDSNPPWIDPERDVESYMKSIGQTASLDALIQAAAYRPRGQWAPEFSAEKINLYIRRGFDVQPFD